jgi:hypothetical protein
MAQWRARSVLLLLLLISAFPALSQSSPADGPWFGQIQCQLDVQQQGYERHETQTWKLTSSMPVSKNGDMQIYSATWTATGQGGIQRAVGLRASQAQWNINVPPAGASVAMFVRAQDKQFIIRIWQRPAPSYTGMAATRQMAENGMAQPPAKLSATVHEWVLPWIEVEPGAKTSSKLSVPVESLGADLTPQGPSPMADCTWQFARTVSTIGDEQAFTNNRVLKDYTTSLQQSWKKNQQGAGTSVPGLQVQVAPTVAASTGGNGPSSSGAPTLQKDPRLQSTSTLAIAPALAQVSPNQADIGTKNLNLTVIGTFTNFTQGTTVELISQKAIEEAIGKSAGSYADILAATSLAAGGGGGGGGASSSGQSPPSTLKALSVRVISPTQAVAVFNIDPPVFAGAYNVVAKTGSEQAALIEGFTLTQSNSNSMLPASPSGPKVTQAAPNSLDIGSTSVKVTITGSSTHFVQGTNYAPGTTVELWSQEAYVLAAMQKVNDARSAVNPTGSFGSASSGPSQGPSVKATFVAVPSTTVAVATFDINSSLVPGPYVVVARTGSEQAALTGAFTLTSPGVYAAPANATTTEAPAGNPLASATVVPFTPAIQTSTSPRRSPSTSLLLSGTDASTSPPAVGAPSARPEFGGVSVSWTAPQNAPGTIDFYEVQSEKEGASTTATTTTSGVSATVALPACPYPEVDCAAPNKYQFRVRAHSAGGYGDYSPSTSYVRPYISYNADRIFNIWTAKGCVSCHQTGSSLDLASMPFNSLANIRNANLLSSPPASSKLLTCPTKTGNCSNHSGSPGFDLSSREYHLLLQWISDGGGQ